VYYTTTVKMFSVGAKNSWSNLKLQSC